MIVHEVSSFSTKAKNDKNQLRSFDLTCFDMIFQEYGVVKQDSGRNIVNDIAIIFLPKPAVFNPGVQPVCLPYNPNEYRLVTAILL